LITPTTLEAVFREAVAACDGTRLVRGHAADLPAGELTLLAVGKAAAAMARGVLAVAGARVRGGEVTTRDEPLAGLMPLAAGCAGHPLPDERSLAAARRALACAALGGGALVVLISGGASALWAAPADGLTLSDKRAATLALARAGKDIAAVNTVRKQISAIKGGRLATAAAGRELTVLVLSDVLGDRLDLVGSGPCARDATIAADALAIAGTTPGVPESVRAFLRERAAHAAPPSRADVRHVIVGNHETLRQAAVRALERRGLYAHLLPPFSGAVEDAAQTLLALGPAPAGTIFLAGGEPTVTVHGSGKGGRAQHLALLMARGLRLTERVFLAAGSDGSDGDTPACGAVVDGATWDRACARGLDPDGAIAGCDAYPVHAALSTALAGGATGTNLLDLYLLS
jgi:glycerate-2-kinase